MARRYLARVNCPWQHGKRRRARSPVHAAACALSKEKGKPAAEKCRRTAAKRGPAHKKEGRPTNPHTVLLAEWPLSTQPPDAA